MCVRKVLVEALFGRARRRATVEYEGELPRAGYYKAMAQELGLP